MGHSKSFTLLAHHLAAFSCYAAIVTTFLELVDVLCGRWNLLLVTQINEVGEGFLEGLFWSLTWLSSLPNLRAETSTEDARLSNGFLLTVILSYGESFTYNGNGIQ